MEELLRQAAAGKERAERGGGGWQQMTCHLQWWKRATDYKAQSRQGCNSQPLPGERWRPTAADKERKRREPQFAISREGGRRLVTRALAITCCAGQQQGWGVWQWWQGGGEIEQWQLMDGRWVRQQPTIDRSSKGVRWLQQEHQPSSVAEW